MAGLPPELQQEAFDLEDGSLPELRASVVSQPNLADSRLVEVRLSATEMAQLNRAATQSGQDPEDLVRGALLRYLSGRGNTLIGMRAHSSSLQTAPTRFYPGVYRNVLFPLLDGKRGRIFSTSEACDTPAAFEATADLRRCGAVIDRPHGRMSLADPMRALHVFAVAELLDDTRLRWAAPEVIDELATRRQLIPGSGQAVLANLNLSPNPICPLPATVWHGLGPTESSPTPCEGYVAFVNDELRDRVPLAVAYADLFSTPGWRSAEFSEYLLAYFGRHWRSSDHG